MTTSQRRAVIRHRERLQRRGIVRLEVQVQQDDVPLVRGVVAALADPAGAAAARALLRPRFAPQPAMDLKTLLASAPLEGVDLDRPADVDRAIEL